MNTINVARIDEQFNLNCALYTERICELNDQCRRRGDYVYQHAITDLGDVEVSRITEKIINFTDDDFAALEDPDSVHDCGTLQHGRMTITWVIDLHAPENTTLDPADPNKSIRILNVYLTDER